MERSDKDDAMKGDSMSEAAERLNAALMRLRRDFGTEREDVARADMQAEIDRSRTLCNPCGAGLAPEETRP